jgi:hypothetical protein
MDFSVIIPAYNVSGIIARAIRTDDTIELVRAPHVFIPGRKPTPVRSHLTTSPCVRMRVWGGGDLTQHIRRSSGSLLRPDALPRRRSSRPGPPSSS